MLVETALTALTLTVVRHGQTDGNVNRLCEGVTDTPLNINGSSQAKAAGVRLRSETFDFVFASDLKRASETASIIIEENLSFGKECSKEIVKLPVLRERSFGMLEGKPFKNYVDEATQLGVDLLKYTPKEGETLNELKNRAIRFVNMISEIKPLGKRNALNILAVTHGIYIAQLIGYLYEDIKCDGIAVEEITIRSGIVDLSRTIISNTSITIFDIEVNNFSKKIKSCNCRLFISNTHIKSPVV